MDAIEIHVRRLRQERQMTLRQLAAVVGRSKSWLSNIETGQTELRVPHLVPLAAAMGVEWWELFTLPGSAPRCGCPHNHEEETP